MNAEKRRVLVIGGAGYIGSHVAHVCAEGVEVHIVDNLSTGHRELAGNATLHEVDICNKKALDEVFQNVQPHAVCHLGARAAVGESATHPSMYYNNNVNGMWNVLEAMRTFEVKHMVFSSTCAVYQSQDKPLTEDAPFGPVSCYGRTKLADEWMIQDYARAYGISAVIFRYFNAAGAHPDAQIGECHIPEQHLVPLCILNGLGVMDALKVFGNDYNTPDGTCIRDYIHVMDIARAHQLALDLLNTESGCHVFNLGSSHGNSVLEVIQAIEKALDKPLAFDYAQRREGDPSKLVAGYDKAYKVLGWEPKRSQLENIVFDAARWHQSEFFKRLYNSGSGKVSA